MKRILLALCVLAVAFGCDSPTAAKPEESPASNPSAPTNQQTAGTPYTPAPLPNAPVIPPSNLGGGMGDVGQVAKERARSAAGQARSSLDQLPSGE
jgi:hypothetical protein